MTISDDLLEEKHRPKTEDDFVFINDTVKEKFTEMIKNDVIKNLVLHSNNPGSGKTSTAKALVELCDREYLFINFSLNGNIDLLKYHNHCRFICTCNSIDGFPDPLKSRFTFIHYVPDNKKKFAMDILNRLITVVEAEGIKYSKKNLIEIIKKFLPDMRAMLKFIDNNSNNLDTDDLVYKVTKGKIDELFKCLKSGDFKTIKELIINSFDGNSIYRTIYDNLKGNISNDALPSVILCLSDYQKYYSIVPDKHIHHIAMLMELARIINE